MRFREAIWGGGRWNAGQGGGCCPLAFEAKGKVAEEQMGISAEEVGSGSSDPIELTGY